MKRLLLLGALACCAVGCSKDKVPDAAPSAAAPETVAPTASAAVPASAAAAASAAPAPAPVPPAVVAAIPTEEDFEPKAETTITAANASAQLTALEKEIAK